MGYKSKDPDIEVTQNKLNYYLDQPVAVVSMTMLSALGCCEFGSRPDIRCKLYINFLYV